MKIWKLIITLIYVNLKVINNLKYYNMSKFKICGCYYIDNKGKSHNGIYILSRRTNTFVILNKKLEKVTDYRSVVTCESSIGNMFIDLK